MADEVLIFVGKTGDNEFGLLDEKHKVSLPVDELKKNLDAFSSAMVEIVPALKSPATLNLKSVAVAVGINAKGQVGFLGTGAELGGTATMTITFERKT